MAVTKKKAAPASVPAVKAKASVPAAPLNLAAMMKKDTGGGLEGTDKDSFAIPFIKVLQQLSPQCTSGQAEFMEKAKPGMFLNTITGELSKELLFIPCAFRRAFIQWAPRASGEGFKGEWTPERVAEARASGEVVEEEGRLYIGEANPKKSDILMDTRNHFGLVSGKDGLSQALLSLSSTQIKKSKQMMAILSAIRVNGALPPTWASKIKLTTVMESNDQGSWYGIKLEHAGFVESEEEYNAGKAFHQLIQAGKAHVEYAEPIADGDDDTV